MIDYIKRVMSDHGEPSSKRWTSAAIILAVLVGWTYSVIVNGLGEHETDLAEVLVITAGTLLGVTTVAKAFSKTSDSESKE